MKNIFNSIIGKSPFRPMQEHAREVDKCVLALKNFLKARKDSFEKAVEIAKQISENEHNADKIKNSIRSNLGGSMLIPVSKGDLLEILSIQDAIADTAEDIAVLATMKEKLNFPDELFTLIEIVLEKSIDAFSEYKEIIENLDELLEATFTGPQAEQIRGKIGKVALLEHETDNAQKIFMRKFLEVGDSLPNTDFFLIAKITRRIGDLANISEKAANKIRLILLG